jgi:hypothetical protein
LVVLVIEVVATE